MTLASSLLLTALVLPLDAGAAERIEGHIVDVHRAATTTTDFELLRDGARYLLKLTPRQAPVPPSHTRDGMPVPWIEIGSDGTDLYVVRQVDAVGVKTGAIMTGYVLPGRRIPLEIDKGKVFPLEDPKLQLLFLSYLSAGLSSAQDIFPGALIYGEEGLRAEEIQVSLQADRTMGGLPGEAQFRAPGHVYLSRETLDRNPQFKLQARRVGMTASYRLPLPAPHENGFTLVRYRVLEKLKAGDALVPARMEIHRFEVPATGGAPRIIREFQVTATHASVVASPPPEAFRPRIAPDGAILDFRPRLGRLSGKPQRSSARAGWPGTGAGATR